MTDETYIGALDQGTSGTRFVVFDADGKPLSEAFTSNRQRSIGADRIEYDPLKLWGCATDAIRRGLANAEVESEQLRALGISAQRQTVLLWDADSGRPVTGALSWRDRRTAATIRALDEAEKRLIRERTGLEPDPYFAAPNVKWLLDNGSDARDEADGSVNQGSGDRRDRANRGEVLVGTVDAWLLYNLTGAHATDVTNAAQTMLFDIHERAWDDELLDLFDVPRAALPEVHPSSDPEGFGTTDPDGILNTAVPVTGVMGDQQAALLGRVARTDDGARDSAKVTYGTGNFFLQSTGGEPVEARGSLLTTIWFQRAGEPPRYGLEGPVFSTGAILEWLQEIGLLDGGIDCPTVTEQTGAVQLVPSFDGFGAPEWISETSGGVFGLDRQTDREDLLRAAVEAIAFGTRAVIEAAEEATDVEHDRVLVDGGAIQDDAFAQCQADLIGRPLVRSDVTQTTALGAAFAAGMAVEVWGPDADLEACRPDGRTFTPDGTDGRVDEAYRRWRDVVSTVADIHRPG